LPAGGADEADHGTDAVAVRLRPHRADGKPVIAVAAVVAVEVGGAVIGGDHDVEVAIMVEVAIGGAAGDEWAQEVGAEGAADVGEGAVAEVPEDQRRLLIV